MYCLKQAYLRRRAAVSIEAVLTNYFFECKKCTEKIVFLKKILSLHRF